MCPNSHLRLGIVAIVGLAAAWIGGAAGARSGPEKEPDALAAGKELFTREWLQGDKRSFAGDGLGPVFNARSCVACHHQGGVGGAGTRETNATLISVFVAKEFPGAMTGAWSESSADQAKGMKQPDRAKMMEIHPALRTGSTFPLHRFGSEKAFLKWKAKIFSGDRFSNENGVDATDLEVLAGLLLSQDLSSSFGAEKEGGR